MHSRIRADLAFNRLRCFLIVKEAREKSLSAGTEDAGVARKSLAIRAKFGYFLS
jgi:hypothetical protein